MANAPKDPLQDAKRIMGALVRMPPKPHEQMKIGKRTKTAIKKRQAKKAKERS
jgi:hypothetical protein